ncbi:hypothetical protein EVAR_57577_1 [Eumeta japonica]|uniref:Uncharacterized protein n=1 Tax=Eumeta variegata TaxID=151549 RepID=A0A4C1Z9M5_EUMVA|nr:hypothetical protein EVAR_57577_1 [Eumeta japonica]
MTVEEDGESSFYAWENDGIKGSSTCLFERGANDIRKSLTVPKEVYTSKTCANHTRQERNLQKTKLRENET